MEEGKEGVATMDDMEVKLIRSYHYGFNNLYQDVFNHRKEELHEFAELDPEQISQEDCLVCSKSEPDPSHVCQNGRAAEASKLESSKFDDERYVADNYGENSLEIAPLLEAEHPFVIYIDAKNDLVSQFDNLSLLDDPILEKDEVDECLKLRNREYLIDKTSPNLMLQCIDILAAYLYDFRMNGFTDSCESTWTVSKLAGTISCFLDYRNKTVKDLFITIQRRILAYPLYRISVQKIKEDVELVLRIGKKAIVKCFVR